MTCHTWHVIQRWVCHTCEPRARRDSQLLSCQWSVGCWSGLFCNLQGTFFKQCRNKENMGACWSDKSILRDKGNLSHRLRSTSDGSILWKAMEGQQLAFERKSAIFLEVGQLLQHNICIWLFSQELCTGHCGCPLFYRHACKHAFQDCKTGCLRQQ